MPTRPPSDRARAKARAVSQSPAAVRAAVDRRYAVLRRQRHGPDPRSTATWQRLRAFVLAQHPLCADPFGVHAGLGTIAAATEVDHILGIWLVPDRVFDLDNTQPLCHKCHQRKSGAERREGRE